MKFSNSFKKRKVTETFKISNYGEINLILSFKIEKKEHELMLIKRLM